MHRALQHSFHYGGRLNPHAGFCIDAALSYLTSSWFFHLSGARSSPFAFKDIISEQDQHHHDLAANQPESWRPAQVALVYGKDDPQHYGFGDVTANDQQLASALSRAPSTLEHFDATALEPLVFAPTSDPLGVAPPQPVMRRYSSSSTGRQRSSRRLPRSSSSRSHTSSSTGRRHRS